MHCSSDGTELPYAPNPYLDQTDESCVLLLCFSLPRVPVYVAANFFFIRPRALDRKVKPVSKPRPPEFYASAGSVISTFRRKMLLTAGWLKLVIS